MSRPGAWRRDAPQVIDLGGRVPPHNLEVEATVLAHVLSRPGGIDEITSIAPDDWYSDANRRIHEAALELQRKGTPVDLQTVAAWLKDRDWLQAVGGIAYLAKLVDATPTVAHIEAYARIIREKAVLRRVGETLLLRSAEIYTGAVTEPRAWIDQLEGEIHDAVPMNAASGLTQAHDLVVSVCKQLEDVEVVDFTATGFLDVDEQLGGGHRDGELIIIAARPGMGKTSFVMNVATNVARSEPKFAPNGHVLQPRLGVLVFSLEMPKEQLMLRTLCSEARVSVTAVRKKRAPRGEEQERRWINTACEVSQLPLWIDDTPGLSVTELRAKIRRHQREFTRTNENGEVTQRIGAVIVDYLQLMKGSGNTDSREQEIAEISRELKRLAKDLKVPVIALAQLNRAVETRSTKEKRPQLSDLRESGSLEQDADVIIFIYRPEYYLTDKGSAEAKKLKGYAEIIIAKQRNGPTRRVPVTFIEEYTRFENRARDAYRDGEDA